MHMKVTERAVEMICTTAVQVSTWSQSSQHCHLAQHRSMQAQHANIGSCYKMQYAQIRPYAMRATGNMQNTYMYSWLLYMGNISSIQRYAMPHPMQSATCNVGMYQLLAYQDLMHVEMQIWV